MFSVKDSEMVSISVIKSGIEKKVDIQLHFYLFVYFSEELIRECNSKRYPAGILTV